MNTFSDKREPIRPRILLPSFHHAHPGLLFHRNQKRKPKRPVLERRHLFIRHVYHLLSSRHYPTTKPKGETQAMDSIDKLLLSIIALSTLLAIVATLCEAMK